MCNTRAKNGRAVQLALETLASLWRSLPHSFVANWREMDERCSLKDRCLRARVLEAPQLDFWSNIMRTRFLVVTAALAALCTLTTHASAQATGSVCTDGSTSTATGRGACSGHGGVDAKATAAAKKAKTSTSATMVACTDGTSSKGGRGACSGHGGIAAAAAATTAAATPAPAPAPAPAPPPASTTTKTTTAHTTTSSSTGGSGKSENNDPTGATAKCKDGMYSHSAHRTGTCSRHGGVAQWLVS